MEKEYKTKKGFYLDLSKSPWTYETPNGLTLRFPSQKKRDMFIRFIALAGVKIDKALGIAGDLRANIDTKTLKDVKTAIMVSIYKEGSTAWRTRKA